MIRWVVIGKEHSMVAFFSVAELENCVDNCFKYLFVCQGDGGYFDVFFYVKTNIFE